jgi:predicted amidophosphoribosyltransferase
MTCSQGIARSQVNFIYEMKIVHQIDKINLFPPFFAKASATFLFLPPTATRYGYSISKIMLKENWRNLSTSLQHVVIRSATPQLSKKVVSLTVENNNLENAFISLRPILMIAA